MKSRACWFLIGVAFILSPLSACAQEQPPATEAFRIVSSAGVPVDWTDRHVVFSSWADPETLSSNQQDPRYWLQLLRRRGSQGGISSEAADAGRITAAQLSTFDERILRERKLEWEDDNRRGRGDGDFVRHRHGPREPLGRDWS
jgi:hypothetical protein